MKHSFYNPLRLGAIAMLLLSLTAQGFPQGNDGYPAEFGKLKNYTDRDTYIYVSVNEQKLYLFQDSSITKTYPVSTSYLGTGNTKNSNRTPTGFHSIKLKLGFGSKAGTIFKSKMNTTRIGEIFTRPFDTPDDHVMTRILVLEGLEEGRNKGGDVDSYERNIYIHGTPEEGLIGRPFSHGCIRMRNNDIIDLFKKVIEHTVVLIGEEGIPGTIDPSLADYEVAPLVPVYLGNSSRSYYGKGPVPANPAILWKKFIGCGETTIWDKTVKWCGTGWPSQGILVKENGNLNILFGALDHHLWKLDALTGRTAWKYKFDNAVKGTCSVYINETARYPDEKAIAFCGSRKDLLEGKPRPETHNYRAVSLLTGKELWAHEIPRTDSYSRDADGNGLTADGVLYIGTENCILYAINPDPVKAVLKDDFFQPEILFSRKLYKAEDTIKHKGNLVIESSPSLYKNRIYVTSGSGYVFGINRYDGKIEWEFYTGSDINASAVINRKGQLLVGIEKEYIKGRAGVFMLDPEKSDPVAWYFPVKDKSYAGWKGGIIGSVAINDEYRSDEEQALAAFCSLDGYLYIVSQDIITGEKTPGPGMDKAYDMPLVLWKSKIGPSISTPIFIDNYLIAGSYSGILHIFKILQLPGGEIQVEETGNINLGGGIESTPVAWDNKIYIGCKNGWFYCISESP